MPYAFHKNIAACFIIIAYLFRHRIIRKLYLETDTRFFKTKSIPKIK